MKPLIVVLGLGEMGMIHAHNLSKIRAIRLGVASSRAPVAERAAETVCADKTFTSYDAVFQDTDVTAVVIATPPPTHPEFITKAANAAKHIFCEKPLGYDVQTIQQALDAVTRSGVRFMSGFMRRWDPGYIAARKALDDGQIGVPVVLKCTSGDPEYPEKYHRGSAQNAILLDLGVHDIDLARWLTNSEVKSVYALCGAMTYPTLIKVDGDVAIVVLQMHSGASVTMHLSRALNYGYNVTSELVGTEGTIQIGELKMTAATSVKDQRMGTDVAWHFSERFEVAFEKEMEAFSKLVLLQSDEDAEKLYRSNSSYSSAMDGLIATQVAEALVRSYKSGMPEPVTAVNEQN